MNRADLFSNLTAWVTSRISIPAYKWRSKDQGRPIASGARCLISLSSIVTVGQSEVRRDDAGGVPPAGEDRETYVVLWKRGTLGFLIESANQGPEKDAGWYLDELRNQIFLPSQRGIFKGSDVSINKILGEASLDRDIGGRWLSSARLDVLINFVDVTQDDPTTYIETVQVNPRSALRDPSGVLLPDSRQISGKIEI